MKNQPSKIEGGAIVAASRFEGGAAIEGMGGKKAKSR